MTLFQTFVLFFWRFLVASAVDDLRLPYGASA